MVDLITITAPAKAFIKKILESNPNTALVVGYSNVGCSGHKYTFALCGDEEVPAGVEFIQIPGVGRVVIKPNSVQGLAGATLDLHSQDLGEQLIWHNPQATNSCGCGDSFQLPGDESCG